MSSGKVEGAGAVRPGEELEVAVVDKWLKQQCPGLVGVPDVTQFSGGASNWTYRLAYENDDLILRRPPKGTKAKSAHDMAREYRIQAALKPVFPKVSDMIALCQDESVIGAEFYVMRRLVGIIPRRNLPRGVVLDEGQVRELCKAVLDTLILLHQVDVKTAGMETIGTGAGYIERQISGWGKRFEQAKTPNVPNGKWITDWLGENLPKQERICLTHNDFRFDNVVLDENDPTKVIGVLDWELATLGDPLMDLGNTLSYWTDPEDDFLAQKMRRQPTLLPGMMRRREVLEYYCKKTGFEPENWSFYEVYGLFRLSGIIQQIYYRYYHKQTENPEFKYWWALVRYLHWRCKRVIKGK